jgi:bifunctional non-homologous end joining protein LigD
VSLVAFDPLELDGKDYRPAPLVDRKARLASLIEKVWAAVELSEHIKGDGTDIFKAACKLGHEGIVAKRKDLGYDPDDRSAG